jgi:hypothetical protein
MKKFARLFWLLVAGFGIAMTCPAIDYSLHMSDARVYRVALGSGSAPSAADMSSIGIRPGDVVVNTDDDAYFLMSATNVYTKITKAGTITITAVSMPLSSNKVYIGNSSGIATEQTVSGLFTFTTAGVATNSRQGLAWTNATGAGTLTALSISVTTNAIASGTLTAASLSVSTGATATAILTALQTVVATNSTAAFTPQTVTFTNYHSPVYLYGTFTNVYLDVTNTYNAITGMTWTTETASLATNGSVAMTPQTVTLDYAGTNDPAVTVVSQNVTLNYAATNAPAITVTAQNVTLNYAATNAPAITVTPQTATFVKP